MSRPTHIHIDTSALQHNLQEIRRIIAPTTSIIAMVKADAYGHGLQYCTQHLSAADAFGVCCVEEALQICDSHPTQRIVLMEGVFQESELDIVYKHNFDIVIHHLTQIDMLEKYPASEPIRVWLKVDTGMHRLGLQPEEVKTAWERITHCKHVLNPPYLMTHFSDADDLEKPATEQQIQSFDAIKQNFETQYSLANSAAILAWPQTHAHWVRPGIMLYGISPFKNKTGQDYGLKPVMTLRSELIAIRQCKKGDAIAYGGTWTCPEDMLIGVVGIGYGDGYPHHARNGTPVLVNDKIAPLVGTVSMDMLTVDLRQHDNPKVGDPVILWGEKLPVEKVAQHADTIAYELVCHVQKRVKRLP